MSPPLSSPRPRGSLVRQISSCASRSHTWRTRSSGSPAWARSSSGTCRFERAASDAGSFLAGVGPVLLFLLIVLSPLIVVAFVLLWGLLTYRRSEARRLLASAKDLPVPLAL